MVNNYLLKFFTSVSSFIILTIAIWIVALPFMSALHYLLYYLTKEEKMFSMVTAYYLDIFIFISPILATFLTTVKVAMQDVILIVKNELVTNNEETFILDLNEKYRDKINNDIVDMINEVKNKLNYKKNIKVVRVVSDNVNAFAISNIKGDSVITVFDGIYHSMPKEEFKAVIGHELGHIINKDSLFKVINFAFQINIVKFKNYSFTVMNTIQNISNKIPFLGFLVLMYNLSFRIIVFIIDMIIKINEVIMIFSYKQAEYIADSIGAKSTNKQTMINSLTIIKEMENNNHNQQSFLMNLLSEHPKTQNRINKLNKGIDKNGNV